MAAQVIAPFTSVGFEGHPIVRARRLGQLHGTFLRPLIEQFFWSFIILKKPGNKESRK